MVFPADLRNVENLDALALNIEGIINVTLRENLSGLDYPPPSVSLRLQQMECGDLVQLTISAKPYFDESSR